VAYRSLSRLSSPLRAKAFPVCPFLLSSTLAAFAQQGMLLLVLIISNRHLTVVFSYNYFFQYVKELFTLILLQYNLLR
ncbi:hypothetical protein, partial [Desertivirga arenae]|uniref:hypothetical protein n=1 Tax=Desertivirga arenae TaxID=2810309 RepID=UPI001A9744BF